MAKKLFIRGARVGFGEAGDWKAWAAEDYPYFEVVNGATIGEDRVTASIKVATELCLRGKIKDIDIDEFNDIIKVGADVLGDYITQKLSKVKK